jgi:2-cysteine adaptor domain
MGKHSNNGNQKFTSEECAEWLKDTHVNPRTKRKINVEAKKGVYRDLQNSCALQLNSKVKHQKKKNVPDDQKKSSYGSGKYGHNTNSENKDVTEGGECKCPGGKTAAHSPPLSRKDAESVLETFADNITATLQEANAKNNGRPLNSTEIKQAIEDAREKTARRVISEYIAIQAWYIVHILIPVAVAAVSYMLLGPDSMTADILSFLLGCKAVGTTITWLSTFGCLSG